MQTLHTPHRGTSGGGGGVGVDGTPPKRFWYVAVFIVYCFLFAKN